MLILARKAKERIVIRAKNGAVLTLEVQRIIAGSGIERSQVRLGFVDEMREFEINREEVDKVKHQQ